MNLEKWEVTRAKGRNRFLWVNGFLGWGVPTALMWAVVMHFVQPEETYWVRPLIALALFPIGGLFWAHFVWRSIEKKYQEAKKNS